MRGYFLAAILWLPAPILVTAAGLALAEDNQAPANTTPAPQQAPASPSAGTPPPAAAPLPPAQPPAADKRGFLNDIGRWWDDYVADLNVKMKDAQSKFDELKKKSDAAAKDAAAATQDAMKNAAEATKNAATAIVRLPNTRVLEIKERCETAANGAPDCEAAATRACHAKGFSIGQPVDVRSSQACPASVLLSGRSPAEGECPVETVVTRAVCQ